MDESACPGFEQVLALTPDEFCLTLSGNTLPDEAVEALHKHVRGIHKQRVMEHRLSEPGTVVSEIADIA